jgi:hypothetical protein
VTSKVEQPLTQLYQAKQGVRVPPLEAMATRAA